jgi:hypothetical protein
MSSYSTFNVQRSNVQPRPPGGSRGSLPNISHSKTLYLCKGMALSITSEHRLVLTDYDEIINASKRFAAEPRLAETMQIIVIEEKPEKDREIDDTDREHKFRAVTAILTECSKHEVLEAFRWHSQGVSSTRPAEFWEALTKVAPKLQHLGFNFHTHELHRMDKMGISVMMDLLNRYTLLILILILFMCFHFHSGQVPFEISSLEIALC